MKLKIITPEQVVYEGEAGQVSLPTPLGQITVLENHDDLISLLGVGQILTDKESIACAGGLAQVHNNEVKILADTAARNDKLNKELIQRVRQRAEELMKEKRLDEVDFAYFKGQLQEELNKISGARRRTRRHIGQGPGRPEPEI